MNQQAPDNEVITIDPPVGSVMGWTSLRQFNFYRLILSLGFLLGFYKVEWMSFLGSRDPEGFLLAATALLLSSLIQIGMSYAKKPDFASQVILGTTIDIFLITLLAHFSGGLSSSLSMLLIINITATSTLLRARYSILFAALAAMSVLSEQTYSLIQGISDTIEYTRAGLLGLVFFGTSFLASTLSQRVRESEQLADERKADILSLEKLNEDIIQNMRTGIIVVDKDGQIKLANSSAESILGNVALVNKPLMKNILPALDTRFHEWLQQPNMHHKAIRQQKGLPDIQPGFRKLQSTGNTLVFLEDATQLNQRFQQIKLASLGRLTASIAHEIRNPLSAINHAAQLLEESELNSADRKLTDIITAQVQRLDKVVENVLQLSRSQKNDIDIINLNEWLTNFRDEYLLSNNLQPAQIELETHNQDILVQFDPSHLNQVMCNLLTNAITHSNLPAEDIRIRIVCGHDEHHDQPYIRVIDNGPGIPKETVEQIFDPFFTTNSKGSGLGLYISKEMIESNRAKIHYTDMGNAGGSCFTIHLLSGYTKT